MILLADLGNTRMKLAALDEGRAEFLAQFTHAAPDFEQQLSRWLAQQPTPSRVWLASVVDRATGERVEAMFSQAGIEVSLVRTQASALGLHTAYTRHEQLGVDRWLALLALQGSDATPCLTVSVGSALTCDGLSADGRHLGGLIAPTPEAMRQALWARAPGLSQLRGEVHELAISTEDGIESGCVLAAVALIARSRTTLQQRLNQDVGLVLTGGGAAALQAYLGEHSHRPNLVLEGLARWVQSQCTEADA
ncbi:MAG: type III pantothenate kinase [Xanthomonadales bacterium]|nr:type III pantothenate kinase [Xanthomonadales bacterium]